MGRDLIIIGLVYMGEPFAYWAMALSTGNLYLRIGAHKAMLLMGLESFFYCIWELIKFLGVYWFHILVFGRSYIDSLLTDTLDLYLHI